MLPAIRRAALFLWLMIKIRYWTIENLNNCQCQKHIIPALIGAGAAVVGGAMKLFGGNSQQKRDQAFQREMWQKQVEQQDKVNAQQMAYQDKVNAENRAWSNESAVRERIEEAGYNPYLYNGQAGASSASIANSTNLGNSVSAPATNTSQNILEGLGDAFGQVGNYVSQGLAYQKESYDFERKKKADAITDTATGAVAGADAQNTLNQLETSKQAARMNAANAFAQELTNGIMQMQAYDQNGVPLTDEATGRPITLAESRARGENMQLFKSLDKLTQDIRTGQVTEDNLRVDYLLKKYDLTYLKPEQLAFLHQQVSNLIAEYQRINAETKVLRSTVPLNQSQTRLNNQNVQTQQRYAELLGQQTLTEKQQTSIKKVEALFGSSEKLLNIMNSMTPKTNAELVHYITFGIWSKVKEMLGAPSADPASIRQWLGNLNSDDIINNITEEYRSTLK